MIKRIRQYYAKKSRWSIASDILFGLLVLSLLFPPSRQFVLVGIKKVSLFTPRVENSGNRQILQRQDFNWKLINNKEENVRLKDFKGKVIFLNFWATWCPPCIAEMPSIQKLYNRFKDNDRVVFILITHEDKSVVDAFLAKAGYTLPVYRNLEPAPYIISSPSIPTTYIISPRGEIVLSKTGSARWHSEKIVDLIKSLEEN